MNKPNGVESVREVRVVPSSCFDCPARPKSTFACVSKEDCDKVDQLRETVVLSRDQKLSFKDGGRLGFYCLRQGHWKIIIKNAIKEQATRIAGPGDLIGYGAWFFPHQHFAAQAIEPGEACFFSKEKFDAAFKKNPEVLEGIIRALCRTLSVNYQRILGLSYTSVRNRVASVLLSLNDKYGIMTETGSRIDVPVDRKTIASLAATAPETLSRVLAELQEDGLISRSKRTLFILSVDKLRALAESR